MPTTDDEVKRYQRIRDQQLAARKPNERRDKHFVEYRRRQPRRRPVTVKEIIGVFDHKWRGLAIGILLGLVVWVVLSYYVTAGWRDWAGVGAVVVLGGLGMFFGASFDWRDDLRKF